MRIYKPGYYLQREKQKDPERDKERDKEKR